MNSTPADQWSAARGEIESVISKVAVPGVELTVRLHDHRPGFAPGPGGRQLMDLVLEAGRHLGIRIESAASPAAGSSAFAGALGVPTIDGLGPAGGDLMTPGEFVELASLAPRAALLAMVIALLGRSDRKRP